MVGKPVPPRPDKPAVTSAASSSASPSFAAASTPPAAGTESSLLSRHSPVEPPASRKNQRTSGGRPPGRLTSLDAYRGFIMTMLAAEGFGILAFSQIDASSPVWQSHDRAWWQNFAFHFDHPAWRSAFDYFKVSFWDLIQPAFMFMVGVAMPFSSARREQMGQSFFSRTLHALIRSVVLVLMGVFLYSIGHERTNWIFPNVLCQIGLGYFFAWLLLNRSAKVQIAALAVILVGYWGWFRMNPPPDGYDYAAVGVTDHQNEVFEGSFAAWSKNSNIAFRFDQWLLPKLRTVPVVAVPSDLTNPSEPAELAADSGTTAPAAPPAPQPGWFRRWFLSNPEPYTFNGGGYTTLSFIPSIGTALLGILCGQLLLAPGYSRFARLGLLVAAAAASLLLGISADLTVCPIVKRIWTPSWVLFSGGYVIGLLALFYLVFDVLPLKPLAFPLVVVGSNSILAYLLGHELRGWTERAVVDTHFAGIIESVAGPQALDPQWYGPIVSSTAVFLVFWLLLYWLHRQRIFLRI
jgi:predicted acyltransferase